MKNELKKWLDSQPRFTPPGYDAECKVIDLSKLIDLINGVGYTVEAHQEGIQGTRLIAFPTLE